jgi:hypothetical protein
VPDCRKEFLVQGIQDVSFDFIVNVLTHALADEIHSERDEFEQGLIKRLAVVKSEITGFAKRNELSFAMEKQNDIEQ